MLATAESPISVDEKFPWACPNLCFNAPALPNRLDDHNLSWRDYGGMFASINKLAGRSEISKNMDGFFKDAADGKMQNVIYINAYLLGGIKESGHPPADLCIAENFAVQVINAVMSSPQWSSTMLFLTWDEWGGFYDHVKAPVVERARNGRPARYGQRVPCLVISPYAKPGFVSHTLYSHVSILKTIESIYDLKPLTKRDAKANSLLDCLDLSQKPIAPFQLAQRTCPA